MSEQEKHKDHNKASHTDNHNSTSNGNRSSLGARQAIGFCLTLTLVVITIVTTTYIERKQTETLLPADSTQYVVLNSRYPQYYDTDFKQRQYEKKATYYSADESVPLMLQPFDPNTADSVVLRQIGFSAWQAHNLIKYRAKGAFRKKNDLKRLHFMTDSMYLSLEPYITLPDSIQRSHRDSTYSPRLTHYPQKSQEIRELNSADTTILKTIPGIGSYKARQIVRYRRQLGGYYSLSQLQDQDNIDLPDSTLKYLTVDATLITPIDVNHASVERLQNHPYISYTMAKAIYNLRRERFRLNSIDELVNASIISSADTARLRPYLMFE